MDALSIASMKTTALWPFVEAAESNLFWTHSSYDFSKLLLGDLANHVNLIIRQLQLVV